MERQLGHSCGQNRKTSEIKIHNIASVFPVEFREELVHNTWSNTSSRNKVSHKHTSLQCQRFSLVIHKIITIQVNGTFLDGLIWDCTAFRRRVSELPWQVTHALISSISCYIFNGYSSCNFFLLFFCKFHLQGAKVLVQVLDLSGPLNILKHHKGEFM